MLKGRSLSKDFRSSVRVYDKYAAALEGLKTIIEGRVSEADSINDIADCDTIFLAIHPPVMAETLADLKPFLRQNAFIVSLAPKITLKTMKETLKAFQTLRGRTRAPTELLAGASMRWHTHRIRTTKAGKIWRSC
jgi:pyrroline-5-carboxylate reductase